MRGNKVLSGTAGKLWVDDDLLSNSKSFEAKVTGNFEDIKIAGEYGTDAKYMGYSIAGTINLHKIDSKIAKKVADGFISGNLPEITLISGIDDPAADGIEKVQLDGVYFTEFTLNKWEVGAISDEEVPFRARTYKYLETI